MKYWFRGKRGGMIAFLAVALLVAGGLGWVTAEALRLERAQLEARAEAELSSKLRIALWRLDSRMVTAFTNEANRPYGQYRVQQVSAEKPSKGSASVMVLELALLPGAAPAPWMGRQVVIACRRDWHSAPALGETLVRQLGISGGPPRHQLAFDNRQLLAELSSDQTWQRLLTQLRQEDIQLARARETDVQNWFNSALPAGNTAPQQYGNRDTELRYAVRAQGARAPGQEQNNGLAIDNTATGTSRKSLNQEPAILGPLIPLWLTESSENRLVVARLIQVGPKMACHVALLEWPAVQTLLAEHIADLFPDARFLPIRHGEANPERAMTALPVELAPGPAEAPAPQTWGPVRTGLILAWAAALVALLTVGLGGWSLLDLSERRICFVSAVTHELRTPLTTLRLYLDMLTGGLVREERQKTEYLRTLSAEAERLHRLIGNVLDFSRLENQRPRLEMSTARVGAIVEQLRSTWEDRCRSAEKQLMIDPGTVVDALVQTDVQIVHQVLGNLIDNACKYSRGASDPNIWIRARFAAPGHLVFEVEDGGPGVPPSERRSIFRPFRRGRDADVAAGGVGLGLALAQRWTELLRGRLTLRSSPKGSGACFRLELPVEIEKTAV